MASLMAAEQARPMTLRRAALQQVGRVPKYRKVKDELMRGILAGEYRPGTCLPSENELAKRFGVSRVTVRMALDLLREAQLVDGHQGKGHVVRNLQATQDLGRLQGFGEIMAPLGVVTRSQVLSAGRIKAPPEVAQALQLERGAPVIKIERLRIAANVTMSMDVSFFPLEIGESLLGLDLANVDIFKLIETSLSVEIGFADIVMDVVLPEPKVRDQLGLDAGEKLIRIERLTYDQRCRPIDFEYLFGRAESHRFKLRVPRW
ncbi:GntR family transcriptional regulator [Chelativorans xinjiangense]|uniref:GntR family transcriptional regulator n=1 Tax=Chelativorans xinjiangense TaxID=2681485 RepID=UPI001FE7B948|nr:GntR family transcriptional regulator [Chelativorans xinjiangense]